VARHFGRAALETLWLQRISVPALEKATRLEGEEHLRAGLELGRGVILLSAHVGVWEVAALITGRRLPDGVMLVHRPLDNPLLEAELARLRARFGNRLVGKHRIQGELKRELAGGGVVGILLDQRPPDKLAVKVPFFGHPTPTNSALALLARVTRAPVVPVWGLWDAPGRYTVRFEEPLLLDGLDGEERTTPAITARCTARIEGVIRERPEQWLWFHDRWRGLSGAGQ
jgi:KDO2-lipid IV(A) lauroyltransferase